MKFLIKIIIALLSTLSALMLIAAGFASAIGPSKFEIITFLGLGFEYLVLLNLLMIVLAAFFGKYFAILPLVAIGVTFPKPFDMVQFHTDKSIENVNPENSVKVMTYNVRFFNKYLFSSNDHQRDSILEFMRKEEADIYLIQEFYHNPDKNGANNLNRVPETLNTPHVYYEGGRSPQSNPDFFFGLAVLSKHPIVKRGDVVSYKSGKSQAVYADIKVGEKIIRVYNIHLQSLGFDDDEYKFLKRNHDYEIERAFEDLDKTQDRLIAAAQVRVSQIMAIEDHMRGCEHPIIIAGNFNETPFSFNTSSLRQYMQDGFISQGKGLGTTFFGKGITPPLRLDYIYASRGMSFFRFNAHDVDYSDHKPVTATLHF